MAVTYDEVIEAFKYFYTSILSKNYAKSVKFEHYTESQLLPLMRAFLLGYFWDDMQAELTSSLPGRATKSGRIDFLIDDIAVELAVRSKGSRTKRGICARGNETEVKKLLRHDGRGVLILFDFASNPLTDADLQEYRELPSLGSGRWKTSSFQVAYICRTQTSPRQTMVVQKQIRAVRSKRKSAETD